MTLPASAAERTRRVPAIDQAPALSSKPAAAAAVDRWDGQPRRYLDPTALTVCRQRQQVARRRSCINENVTAWRAPGSGVARGGREKASPPYGWMSKNYVIGLS